MIGQRLGPYTIEAELGSGGMGTVYRATGPDGTVALKVVHPHLLATPGFFKRFLREAEIGKAVRHENVVRSFDCDATLLDGQQQNFLVMEYVEGQTLRDLLNELERVPEELCRHIGREVAKGLAAIHEAGVLHRDLKPENILITPDHVVKVMDLGVARLQEEAIRLSQAGAFVGSLEYAAPEQFRPTDGDPDGRADLHALGVILYELATGQHPFRDEDPSRVIGNILESEPRKAGEVNPQLSPFVEEVVHTLIAKDREQRFTSAATLAAILDEGERCDWWRQRARALRLRTKRPLRRIRIPRETALYGRDEDLARLHALYEKAKAGEGQVLLIEGEAGIGKTRLVDEFVGQLRQRGEDVNFLFGSYPPGGAATAAGAFSTAYREHFGAEGLEDALRDYLTVTPLLIPAFGALLKGDATPSGAEPLTKDSLQTVFVHATRGLAAERTTIVLIDDLHFAPEDGRALLASLAHAVPGHRILLIGTMRPGVPEDWVANVERQEQASRTILHRLGPKDLFLLLKDSFRSDRLARELGLQISVKSDGNPFFAFEIIRGLREGQFIAQKADGTWVTTELIEEIQVPSSVLDLVKARVADLSEEERDLLNVAACWGFEFDATLIGAALGAPYIPTLKRLSRIERRHRLVRCAGESFAFDHHQVQESLYAALPRQLAREYHAALATALEERVGAPDREPRELEGDVRVHLCEQFLKSSQPERALRYLRPALAHLADGFLRAEAVKLADGALSAPGLLVGPERVEVLLEAGMHLHFLESHERRLAMSIEAEGIAREAGNEGLLAKARNARGGCLLSLGRFEESTESLQSAVELARHSAEREVAIKALYNLGLALEELYRLDEAEETFTRAIALAQDAKQEQLEARVWVGVSRMRMNQGRFAESREALERGVELSGDQGSQAHHASFLLQRGGLDMVQGFSGAAETNLLRALDLSRKTGARAAARTVLANLGTLYLSIGDISRAAERHEQQRVWSLESGDPYGEASALIGLGNARVAEGFLEEALRFYEQSRKISARNRARHHEAIALVNLGATLSSLGDPTAALEVLQRCRDICREHEIRRVDGFALRSMGLARSALGDEPGATALLREAVSLDRDVRYPYGLADSLQLLGDQLLRLERSADAEPLLQEARDVADSGPFPGNMVTTRCLLAQLPNGDVDGALRVFVEHEKKLGVMGKLNDRFLLWQSTRDWHHLAEAKRLLDHVVEHAPEEYRESMLNNVRINREILEAWEKHGGEATE